MRLQEFKRLPQQEQTALLYEQGVYIGKRKQGATVVVLYQLEGFYAEVFFRVYRRIIDRIFCFSDTKRLDPYLNGMDVEQLVM